MEQFYPNKINSWTRDASGICQGINGNCRLTIFDNGEDEFSIFLFKLFNGIITRPTSDTMRFTISRSEVIEYFNLNRNRLFTVTDDDINDIIENSFSFSAIITPQNVTVVNSNDISQTRQQKNLWFSEQPGESYELICASQLNVSYKTQVLNNYTSISFTSDSIIFDYDFNIDTLNNNVKVQLFNDEFNEIRRSLPVKLEIYKPEYDSFSITENLLIRKIGEVNVDIPFVQSDTSGRYYSVDLAETIKQFESNFYTNTFFNITTDILPVNEILIMLEESYIVRWTTDYMNGGGGILTYHSGSKPLYIAPRSSTVLSNIVFPDGFDIVECTIYPRKSSYFLPISTPYNAAQPARSVGLNQFYFAIPSFVIVPPNRNLKTLRIVDSSFTTQLLDKEIKICVRQTKPVNFIYRDPLKNLLPIPYDRYYTILPNPIGSQVNNTLKTGVANGFSNEKGLLYINENGGYEVILIDSIRYTEVTDNANLINLDITENVYNNVNIPQVQGYIQQNVKRQKTVVDIEILIDYINNLSDIEKQIELNRLKQLLSSNKIFIINLFKDLILNNKPYNPKQIFIEDASEFIISSNYKSDIFNKLTITATLSEKKWTS